MSLDGGAWLTSSIWRMSALRAPEADVASEPQHEGVICPAGCFVIGLSSPSRKNIPLRIFPKSNL
jgi:hypothetical protein